MNGSSDNNALKHNIMIPNNSKQKAEEEAIEVLKCDDIPICNNCLFEIESGTFICNFCKVNLCDLHLCMHNKKFHLDDKSKNLHKIYRLENK